MAASSDYKVIARQLAAVTRRLEKIEARLADVDAVSLDWKEPHLRRRAPCNRSRSTGTP